MLGLSFPTISRHFPLSPAIFHHLPPSAYNLPHTNPIGFVYVSGQIPYTPENKPLENPTIAQQAERVLENVKAVLEASNSSLEHVVKNTVFLTDMDQFAEFNSVYVKYFNTHKPARSCVAVKQLPLGVPLEMESIAIEKDDSSKL